MAAVIAIFLVFFIIGYLAAGIPEVGKVVVSSFKEEVSPLKELSPVGLMLGIFANNALKCLLVIVLGLLLGLVPLFFMLANGLILGIVIGVTMKASGLLYVLAGVIPHGIIELPMVFLSAAMGLYLGTEALKSLLEKREGLTEKLIQSLLIYFAWIFPLLFLAAFIETFVTGPILYILFGAHG
jgi:stage II sporulation protein M